MKTRIIISLIALMSLELSGQSSDIKVIQNQKMDLTSKIADLRTVINKKETAIKTFSNYLFSLQGKCSKPNYLSYFKTKLDVAG